MFEDSYKPTLKACHIIYYESVVLDYPEDAILHGRYALHLQVSDSLGLVHNLNSGDRVLEH